MSTQIVISPEILRPESDVRTKYNVETVTSILQAITDGCTVRDACYIAGISRTTYDRWMKQEPEFSEAILVAEAEYKRAKLKLIAEAGKATNMWSANAWLLERKWPEQYGKRTELDVTSGGQPLKTFIGFTPDQWDADDVVEGEVVDDE